VEGLLRKRDEDDYNLKTYNRDNWNLSRVINYFSKALNVLPFEVITSHEVNEELRLKYRYLDLRNPKIHENIIFRSQVIDCIREKMKG
jgi:aspartyl-tRNA synthetase